ncbi:MAG: ASPIC/UnbV domain-containing protein [Proteobacteria bacterium]|nr:ASPIC/UnbV domain-containing protein [Pseudomonadota bacterium]
MLSLYYPLEEGSSISGNERNRLFINDRGRWFTELSGLANLDSPADGRIAAIFDYDRDGWSDVGVVSVNSPSLQLFRNRLGDRGPSGRTSRRAARRGGMIAVRLVGSNRGSKPSPSRSPRDGVGARVDVKLPAQTIRRAHSLGSGLAAQNSAIMRIGIGAHRSAETITVRWPSGVVQTITDVAEGSLLTVYEDPTQAPVGRSAGKSARISTYRRPAAPRAGSRGAEQARLTLGRPRPDATMILYVTMATWCQACKAASFQARLSELYTAVDGLHIIGVPIDPDDIGAMLDQHAAKRDTSYELLGELTGPGRESINRLVEARLHRQVLPASILTDRDGRVLLVKAGPPTLSDIRRVTAP